MYGSDFLGGDPARWTTGLLGRIAAQAAGSTLLNDLVAYWPLNEVSGTRADSVGSNDLTDNNTVGSSLAGPSGTVASFVRDNDESLSLLDNATTVWGEDGNGVTFSVWVKIRTDLTVGTLCALFLRESDVRNWEVYVEGTTQEVHVQDEAGIRVDSAPLATGTWHHVLAWFDPADKKSYVSVDGSTPLASAARASSTLDSTTGYVTIGRWSYADSGADWDLARAAVWGRVLTSGERTSLFNSGNGKAYSALTTDEKVGLVSYWNLDEVSGTRADSHGANDLTDNNTVGASLAGPSGTVAKFTVGNSESLTHADDDSLTPNNIAISVWVKETALGEPGGIVYKWNSGYGYRLIRYQSQWQWWVSTDGSNYINVPAISAPVTGQWTHIVAWTDGARARIAINGVEENSDVFVGNLYNDGNPFAIGNKSTVNGEDFDGQIANLGLWSRALTAGELTSLFNSGVGKSYADLTAAEKVGLVSYWDLSETSGTRADSHGANDLTDNNTVGSVVNAGGAMSGAAASFVAANTETLSGGVINPAGDLYVAAWIKYTGAVNPALAGILGTGDGNANGWGFALYNGTLYFQLKDPATQAASFSLTQNEWTFIEGWYKAGVEVGAAKNLVDAAPDSVSSSTITPVLTGFRIGSYSDASYPADVIVDEVGVWNRVLTADERTELWNAGKGKFYPFT